MKKLYLFLLFIFLSSQSIHSQTKKVTGKVLNMTDKSSMPGVNIKVKGSSGATSTDFDGTFSISASTGDVLVFSFIGFQTKEVKIFEYNELNVYLEDSTKTLDEVVVLGSTVKSSKKELGNVITSVKSKDLLRAQPNSLSSALQGKVAGAQISQNSGDPSGGFTIKLRGTSSILGSSDPLYVIDGVVMSNNTTNVSSLYISESSTVKVGANKSSDINPNDIESIEVLNGGAAAAIYGSRAANGVVLITTKKGKLGKPTFTFSTSTVINSLRKKLDLNLVNKQFKSTSIVQYTVAPLNNVTPAIAAANPVRYAEVNNDLGQAFLDRETFDVQRYDYQDQIFRTGFGSDTYFSVQGGNESTKYSSSVGYLNNEGIIKNSDFKRLGIKLGLQHQLTPKLNVSLGLNYINSFSKDVPDGNNFLGPLNSINITNNIYDLEKRDANGRLLPVDSGRTNPLSILETFTYTQNTDRVIADVQLNYKPLKNLFVDLIVGVDKYIQKGGTFIPRSDFPVNVFPLGYVSEASNSVTQINNDLNLRYVWNISSDLKSTTSGGYNIQLYRDKFNAIAGTNLKPFVESISAYNIVEAGYPLASEGKYNIWGYYLQQTFGYKNKLFITGAIRNDASTVFSKENRSQYFPKLSGSYVLSSEDFMRNSAVSTARLRASWGESGSLTAIGPYARFTNYTTGDLVGNTVFSIEGNRKGNLDLRPERSSTYEVGIDLGFLKDRFNFTFTYYNADIKDLLFGVETAASTGALRTIQNIGKMNNKGYEATLKFDLIKKDKLNVGLFATYSSNKNKVTELPQERFTFSNGSGANTFAIVGEPLGVYYARYFARNPDGSLLLNLQGLPQVEKGNPVTNTAQRDPITGQPIGTSLNKIIGDPNPDYIISLGGNLNYKNFGMSFLFDGVQGVDVFDADYRTRQNVGAGELAAKELTGELPRGYVRAIGQIEEFRIVDGSYIKLREVSLNYSFGKLNNLFSDFTITASGRNLYSWDKFTSYDPEVNSAGQSSVSRYNFGAIPIPRSFAIALKFQF